MDLAKGKPPPQEIEEGAHSQSRAPTAYPNIYRLGCSLGELPLFGLTKNTWKT